MNSFEPRSFDQLRQVVHPSLAALPGTQLRARIDGEYGEGTADLMESDLEIFGGIGRAFSSAARDVGRFAQKAAPVVANIGGGVIQGAMAGSAAGLPGIIAGAAIGGTGAGLSRYGGGTARKIGGAMSGITSLAGQSSRWGKRAAPSARRSAPSARCWDRAAAAGRRRVFPVRAVPPACSAGSCPRPRPRARRTASSAGVVPSTSSPASSSGRSCNRRWRRCGSRSRPQCHTGRRRRLVGPRRRLRAALGHLVGEAASEMAESSAEGEGEAAEHDFMRGESGEFVGDPSNFPIAPPGSGRCSTKPSSSALPSSRGRMGRRRGGIF